MYRAGSGIWRVGASGFATRAAAPSWTPLSLGATLKGWWDFSDASTLYTDAGTTLVSADAQAIYQANDKSGNGLHLTQATEANRPSYQTAEINGLSVARLAGGDHMLRASVAGTAVASADGVTLIMVAKQSGATANNTNFYWGATDGSNCINAHWTYSNTLYWDTANQGTARIFKTQPAASWDDTWHIVIGWRSGTTSRIYIDGTMVYYAATISGNLNTAVSANLVLGNNGNITIPYNGDIAETILCDSGLSDANLQNVVDYLATKYAITQIS